MSCNTQPDTKRSAIDFWSRARLGTSLRPLSPPFLTGHPITTSGSSCSSCRASAASFFSCHLLRLIRPPENPSLFNIDLLLPTAIFLSFSISSPLPSSRRVSVTSDQVSYLQKSFYTAHPSSHFELLQSECRYCHNGLKGLCYLHFKLHPRCEACLLTRHDSFYVNTSWWSLEVVVWESLASQYN